MRRYNSAAILSIALLLTATLHAQTQPPDTTDSDKDGLSDTLEQSLVTRFAPTFMVARQDCSNIPAQFQPNEAIPHVAAEDGTIYAQATPASALTASSTAHTIELRYYHLWKTDCGQHGHPLDAEHVSVLISTTKNTEDPKNWKALYWYAAAHENTVCDVSQVTRAATLRAEDHGATIWISPGKHASFLNQALCARGCGADRCDSMQPLAIHQIINLGELAHPMNGALWTASPQWPLSAKLTRSDFPSEPIARLETLPTTDIAWFSPGRHPAQGVIAISSSTAGAIGTSGDDTLSAISLAGDSTGNALQKSYRKTIHALGISAQHVGDALHLNQTPE
jgi:hypothetical protein